MSVSRSSRRPYVDVLLGELDGGIATWTAAGLPVESIPMVTADHITGTVLDIRQDDEWNAGHVPGAIHVELGDLATATVAAGPLTVMCAHGERAMSGASRLLSRLSCHLKKEHRVRG